MNKEELEKYKQNLNGYSKENKVHVLEHYDNILKDKQIDIPNQKSWQYIMERNKGREDNIAISDDIRKLTYDEMYTDWEEVARAFSALGIEKSNDSKVLIIMPNLIKTCSLDYGSNMTGAVADFIDPTSSFEKIREYIIRENITDIVPLDLLMLKNLSKHIDELKGDLGIRNIIMYQDMFMNLQVGKKLKLVSEINHFMCKFSKKIIRYDDLVKNTKNERIRYDDTFETSFITHTSGTTSGIGKPIPLTDHNRNSLVNQYELANFNFPSGMKMMHFIPYFAAYGTVNTVHLGLSNGAELQQIPLFSPGNFGIYMVKYNPSAVIATTPCWLSLVDNPKYENIDLSNLVMAATGGSPTSIEDEIKINHFLEAHGSTVRLTIGYGMSELAGCAITKIPGYYEEGTMGVPLPGVDIKIRDEITGDIHEISEKNIKGEALINSNTMTSGILDGNEVVPVVEIDGKKYIKTNDAMEVDQYGQIKYLYRIDGAFQRYDGYNVYPSQIEKNIKKYEEIDECAIVPVYDDNLKGNVPKIYIKFKDGVDMDKKLFIDNLINNLFINGNFRDMPHVWVFLDEMPKNTMSKIDHYKLKNGVEGETFNIVVDENNMKVASYEIISSNMYKRK